MREEKDYYTIGELASTLCLHPALVAALIDKDRRQLLASRLNMDLSVLPFFAVKLYNKNRGYQYWLIDYSRFSYIVKQYVNLEDSDKKILFSINNLTINESKERIKKIYSRSNLAGLDRVEFVGKYIHYKNIRVNGGYSDTLMTFNSLEFKDNNIGYIDHLNIIVPKNISKKYFKIGKYYRIKGKVLQYGQANRYTVDGKTITWDELSL